MSDGINGLTSSRPTDPTAVSTWNCTHISEHTNGLTSINRTTDLAGGSCPSGTGIVSSCSLTNGSAHMTDVQNVTISSGSTTSASRSVPSLYRPITHSNESNNVYTACPRPPLPFTALRHRNDLHANTYVHRQLSEPTNNVTPACNVNSLNAQNHSHARYNGGNYFNNVPNWNRSMDILTALHNAVPHNSTNQTSSDHDYGYIRQSNVIRPIFNYAAPGENIRDVSGFQNSGIEHNLVQMNFPSKPEEANASCNCVPISIPRVSSWSFTKKAPTTPTVYKSFEPRAYPDAGKSMYKIQSADNIRRLQFSLGPETLPSTSGVIASNDRAMYHCNNIDNIATSQQTGPGDAICCQPRVNKDAQIGPMPIPILGNKNHVLPKSAKNCVVHWTNSVENRVCCPETVLYGAVYGLKCLK